MCYIDGQKNKYSGIVHRIEEYYLLKYIASTDVSEEHNLYL
jgi:hypothetical protein